VGTGQRASGGDPPHRVVLDCDPGYDDAIALLLAHGSPDVDLLAVTTVAGNRGVEQVTRNALVVARVVGITGVPFAAGAAHPLLHPVAPGHRIHGETGLDGPELAEPTLEPDPRHAVDLLVGTVLAHEPGTVTLVATGALTNLALAVRREPRIVDRVARVVLMGGAFGPDDVEAEFNVRTDPEAAHIVVHAGWEVVLVGLDATVQAPATPDVVRRVRAVGTRPARFVAEVLEHLGRASREQRGVEHPPVAVDAERLWDLLVDALVRIGEPDPA
jgi:purine nucleosidase